ncbi:MAG TPA: hypothetical protein DCP90_00395 [Clostridiales bacterium]|nr:MAG: hypothetical protein A2Y22_04590 [Clostridiales bacterium GWD2_32_59]HAN09055.1 hypothetical protein [Clostridiales bacterium]
MKFNKWILGIIFLSIIGTVLIYPYLPNQIPIHWGISGEIDGRGKKWMSFITALLPLGMYLLFYMVPFIDPKRENYKLHRKAYFYIVIAVVMFMIVLHWLTIAVNFYSNIDVVLCMRVMFGILFVVLGKYMRKLKFNYFAGIRTPWTLSNEVVWAKTHDVGGYGFMLLGLIMLVTIILNHEIGFAIMMIGVVGITLGLFVYSYIVFNRIKNEENIK